MMKRKHPLLSVALIVRDEEAMLDGCLQSMYYHAPHKNPSDLVPIWDELVVVDTGSVDGTIAIAEKHGARIEHFPWNDSCADARNYAESKCAGDWIYWQDADEIMLEGHQYIRAVVEGTASVDGLRPRMIFNRDDEGNPMGTYARQELLHRNDGNWHWEGAAHEYLIGGSSDDAEQIVVEHLQRPGGDRPNHKDIFACLRGNLGGSLDARHLFYLLREHNYAGHYQEAIGLAEVLLAGDGGWPLQRSDAAVIAGGCWKALGQSVKAREMYLRAIREWGAWAEPYYYLGVLHYDLQQWAEGASWFYACLAQEPPRAYFTDRTIYDWRRYDLLAVCLSKIGRLKEARMYGEKALSVRPNDKRLKDNMSYYGDGF